MNNNDIDARVSELEERMGKLETLLESRVETVERAPVSEKKISVKEYVLSKSPKGDVQKTLAIASYLEQHENMPSFNVNDLTRYFRLAKEPVPGNINDKINMNIKKGHITEAEEKKEEKKAWVVTSLGEQFVNNGFSTKDE